MMWSKSLALSRAICLGFLASVFSTLALAEGGAPAPAEMQDLGSRALSSPFALALGPEDSVLQRSKSSPSLDESYDDRKDAYAVMRFGAKCDGITDDSAA